MIKITINQIRNFEHDLQVSGIKNKQTNKKPKKKKNPDDYSVQEVLRMSALVAIATQSLNPQPPVTSVSPGSLLELQIPRLHPPSTESESAL